MEPPLRGGITMKTRVFAFVIVAILLMFCAVPAYGQGLPPLPHAFYGTVEINDGAAPTGPRSRPEGKESEPVLREIQ